MDLLSQHEAFLRAIFDAPEDDIPRLVYADFLQENGEEKKARLIRVQCELAKLPSPYVPSGDPERRFALLTQQALLMPRDQAADRWHRGFERPWHAALDGRELYAVRSLRERIVAECPHWFGTPSLAVFAGPPLDAARVEALLDLKAFACVTRLDLGGRAYEDEDVNADGDDPDSLEPVAPPTRPTITGEGVSALAAHPALGRVTELLLAHNELDDAAAEALLASPYLENVKPLRLLAGNHFGDGVRQRVVERFGEDAVREPNDENIPF
jgi:uncharacterized protein (TIGR02996 family)